MHVLHWCSQVLLPCYVPVFARKRSPVQRPHFRALVFGHGVEAVAGDRRLPALDAGGASAAGR